MSSRAPPLLPLRASSSVRMPDGSAHVKAKSGASQEHGTPVAPLGNNARMNQTSAKPWEHAKSGEGSASDPLAMRFVESLSYDTRLYEADIRGSLAHAAM